MTNNSENYLLAGGAAELERLQLQARVWEPEAERMLDYLGGIAGWQCLDLGCGAMGILGPLSRRVGPAGRVIGVDLDAKQLAEARAFVREAGLHNVEIVEQDAYHTTFPRESFDLVHVRFVFAPVGRDEDLLREMVALTKPGGNRYHPGARCYLLELFSSTRGLGSPQRGNSERLQARGCDFNAGQRTYGMLRQTGLEEVHIRGAVVALQNGHPYMRLPIQFATSLRQRVLDAKLLTEAQLDEALAACEEIASNPETFVMSFLVTQVWGRKPAD